MTKGAGFTFAGQLASKSKGRQFPDPDFRGPKASNPTDDISSKAVGVGASTGCYSRLGRRASQLAVFVISERACRDNPFAQER